MSRLLGCRVFLEPLETDIQRTESGIFVTNITQGKKHTVHYRVVAVGPGCWERRRGKKRVWVQPECKLGDIVISRHWTDEALPGWAKTVNADREDNTSRVVVDARMIVAIIEKA